MYTLAERLGFPDVDEMACRMTMAQVLEWMSHFCLQNDTGRPSAPDATEAERQMKAAFGALRDRQR